MKNQFQMTNEELKDAIKDTIAAAQNSKGDLRYALERHAINLLAVQAFRAEMQLIC